MYELFMILVVFNFYQRTFLFERYGVEFKAGKFEQVLV